jgi:hypothetical protein
MNEENKSWFDIKLKAKDRITIFLPIGIVIIVVSFFFTFKQTGQTDFENIVIPANYSGVIVYKYINEVNHGDQIIDLKNENGIEKFSASHWNDLYDLSEKGDSLYKKQGETTLKLKKKKNDTVLILKYFAGSGYGCMKRKY